MEEGSGVRATVAIAAFTFTLWRSTKRLWLSSERSTAAAEVSNDIAKRAMSLTRRPWLSLKILPADHPSHSEIDCVMVHYRFLIQNHGMSPAKFNVCVFPLAGERYEEHVLNNVELVKNSFHRNIDSCDVIFPNQQKLSGIVLPVKRDKMEVNLIDYVPDNPNYIIITAKFSFAVFYSGTDDATAVYETRHEGIWTITMPPEKYRTEWTDLTPTMNTLPVMAVAT